MGVRIEVIMTLLLVLLGAGGAGGCKNVCQKAIDHVAGCMEDFCTENADSEQCQQLAQRRAEAPECDDSASQQAEAMLGQGCGQITEAFGAYVRYAGAARRVEATTNVRRLVDGARWYYDAERVTPMGELLPYQFPQSVARTPAEVPCGEAAMPTQSDWEDETWSALNFELRDPYYYSYQFDSRGEGPDATFVAAAFGDLDCDGQLSTFLLTGHVDRGQIQVGTLQSFTENE